MNVTGIPCVAERDLTVFFVCAIFFTENLLRSAKEVPLREEEIEQDIFEIDRGKK